MGKATERGARGGQNDKTMSLYVHNSAQNINQIASFIGGAPVPGEFQASAFQAPMTQGTRHVVELNIKIVQKKN